MTLRSGVKAGLSTRALFAEEVRQKGEAVLWLSVSLLFDASLRVPPSNIGRGRVLAQ